MCLDRSLRANWCVYDLRPLPPTPLRHVERWRGLRRLPAVWEFVVWTRMTIRVATRTCTCGWGLGLCAAVVVAWFYYRYANVAVTCFRAFAYVCVCVRVVDLMARSGTTVVGGIRGAFTGAYSEEALACLVCQNYVSHRWLVCVVHAPLQ